MADQIAEFQRRLTLLEANDAHRRQYVDFQFKTATHAVETALAANEKRLEGLNEFRGAMGDMGNRMITRAEVEARNESQGEKFDADIASIRSKMEMRDRPNYLVGLAAASSLLVMIGGFWTVTGLKIENAITPLIVGIEQIKIGQTVQDQRISENATRLNTMSDNGRKHVEELRTDLTKLQVRADLHK